MSKRKIVDSGKGEPQSKKTAGHWSQGLYAAVSDESLHVYSDDDLVIIKDKYPKAKYHYLVLPKVKIANLKALDKSHIPLLTKMYDRAADLTKDCSVKKFRYGYHAIPSMGLLHLHAISQDFNSPSLKTKKHWNSFTTDYFVDSHKLIEMLKSHGKVNDMSHHSKLLSEDLRCHVCKTTIKNMPTLKTHIQTCFKDS
ncbi:APTX [Bugula neritina]|uniref:APTX n=1 Tax=Bugula neritina TaxID=10212 RepID=A0A7J7JLD8_BUGNE|nr:APTX [Bugula neritina]KAF6026905.1 APTX [Bugula neritina]